MAVEKSKDIDTWGVVKPTHYSQHEPPSPSPHPPPSYQVDVDEWGGGGWAASVGARLAKGEELFCAQAEGKCATRQCATGQPAWHGRKCENITLTASKQIRECFLLSGRLHFFLFSVSLPIFSIHPPILLNVLLLIELGVDLTNDFLMDCRSVK